jgi:hypothetical protein
MRLPTTRELRTYGTRVHKRGLTMEQVAIITPHYVPDTLTKKYGYRNAWFFYYRHNGRNAIIRDVHLKPAEMLLDFQDKEQLLWVHPDEAWVKPGDGIEGPWPGPRWNQ